MTHPPHHQSGFTLLELLVVVAIIALLAAYVGPKYFSQVGKAEQGVARAQIQAFSRALGAYRLDLGAYPSTEAGLAALLSAAPGSGLASCLDPVHDLARSNDGDALMGADGQQMLAIAGDDQFDMCGHGRGDHMIVIGIVGIG